MQTNVIHVDSECVAAAVQEAAACLRGGGLVVLPTETVYGVAADPHVEGAVGRLAAAKGRDRDKPVALLSTGVAAINAFGVVLGAGERRLADRFWPGSLTMVLPLGDGFEGFRVPDHPVALALLAETGVLRVTSANLSGEPPALTATGAVAALGERVDLVLDGGRVEGGVASTVIRVASGRVEVLRDGPIPRDAIEQVWRG
jgi:L-threonylcarbamoyladenylate synthase